MKNTLYTSACTAGLVHVYSSTFTYYAYTVQVYVRSVQSGPSRGRRVAADAMRPMRCGRLCTVYYWPLIDSRVLIYEYNKLTVLYTYVCMHTYVTHM